MARKRIRLDSVAVDHDGRRISNDDQSRRADPEILAGLFGGKGDGRCTCGGNGVCLSCSLDRIEGAL